MRKPIIAGNWKMNKTLGEAVSFVEEVKSSIPAADKAEAVVCAPALFLEKLTSAVKGTDLKVAPKTCILKKTVRSQVKSARSL